MTQDREELKRLAEAATKRFAGPKLKPDGYGLQIWADSQKGGDAHVLDVRGWGYLTGGGHGALGLSEADGIEAQRAVQANAAAAWNAVPPLLSDLEARDAEVERWHSAYDIAHDQAMENGAAAKRAEADLEAMQEALRRLEQERKRPDVRLVHLKRAVAVQYARFFSKEPEA